MKFNTTTVSTGARASQGKGPQPVAAALLSGVFLLSIPMEVNAFDTVYDPAAVKALESVAAAVADVGAEIKALYTLIDTQTNKLYLANIVNELVALNITANTLVLQNIVSPQMLVAVAGAVGGMNAAITPFLAMGAAGALAPVGLEAMAQTEGLAVNSNPADLRFYMDPPGTGLGPASCSSDASAAGVALSAKCMEVHNLRAYRALHAGQYQTMLAAAASIVNALQLAPQVNIADVHMKNQAVGVLRSLQQVMAEMYRGQQDYLQARIEIASEVRQALAQKKSGKSRPGGLLGLVLSGAAKGLFYTARTVTPKP